MAKRVHIVPIIRVEGPSDCRGKPDITANGGKTYGNWGKYKDFVSIDVEILNMAKHDFRQRHLGGDEKPIKYTWAYRNWVHLEENPRCQWVGQGTIRDYVRRTFGQNFHVFGDGEALNYHNPRPDGTWAANANYPYEQWNRTFYEGAMLEILAHMLVDRRTFPSVFVAGGTIEDEALSQFLERHIPLDFSSRGHPNYYPKGDVLAQDPRTYPPMGPEILFDWRGTPSDWTPYRPAVGDYRQPGAMSRTIFLCLDAGEIHSMNLLNEDRIRQGFQRANEDGPEIVVSYFTHDFVQDLVDVIRRTHELVAKVAKDFPGVGWKYSTAQEAALHALGINDRHVISSIEIKDDSFRIITLPNPIDETTGKIIGVPFAVRESDYAVIPVTSNGDGTFTIKKANIGANQKVVVAITDETFYVSIRNAQT